MKLKENKGKNLKINTKFGSFYRYPVKTHLIVPSDNLMEIIKKYALSYMDKNDIMFISEKVVSVMQGRSYKISDIKPSRLATLLSKYVYRNPGGIGLAMPETMHLAIEEAGIVRILLAAFLAAITKPFGLRGVFYIIAGQGARSIDGPVPYAIPPYNEYASKGPKSPQKIVKNIEKQFKIKVTIVDANDLGINILGNSKGTSKKMLRMVLKDNPLGQEDESTPIGIIKRVAS
jgi:F420-0:gamma-glutamyl ligase